jgi:hypothetical protein
MGRRRNTKSGGGGSKRKKKDSNPHHKISNTNNNNTNPSLGNDDDTFALDLLDMDIGSPLEYDIGTRVQLNLKGNKYTGTVAAQWVGRKCWLEDCKAPYLVLVDDGMAIYCRRTDKDFIKRSDVPPMEVIHSE